jgi:hypothetical protein
MTLTDAQLKAMCADAIEVAERVAEATRLIADAAGHLKAACDQIAKASTLVTHQSSTAVRMLDILKAVATT